MAQLFAAIEMEITEQKLHHPFFIINAFASLFPILLW